MAADLSGGLSAQLLGAFGLGVLLPLLGLIAGTGVIGPEIDDGSIVYLLAKPLNRPVIVVTKLAVAIGVTTLFGALPVFIAGMVLTGEVSFALSYAIGALAAGIAYCALFLLLAVVTRNAVVIGLFYALIWESLIGGFVPGAQTLSVQQWGLALTERFLGTRGRGAGHRLGHQPLRRPAAVDHRRGRLHLVRRPAAAQPPALRGKLTPSTKASLNPTTYAGSRSGHPTLRGGHRSASD